MIGKKGLFYGIISYRLEKGGCMEVNKILVKFPNLRREIVGLDLGEKRVFNLTNTRLGIKFGRNIITLPKSGLVARVVPKDSKVISVGSLLIEALEYKISNLPDKKEDVFFIVEESVFFFAKRDDLLVISDNPNDHILGDNGEIIGSLFLRRICGS